MRIALFGHGTTGRLVAERARAEGGEVARVFTSRDAGAAPAELAEELRGLDAAVDFSVAEAVLRNVEACVSAGVPIVVGTTGWLGREREARRLVEERGGALVYGANFSVGVNLFYKIVGRAAELFARFEAYAPFVEEAHHARKRDAPSGTALKLRELIKPHYESDVPVASTRAGHIPGTHRVGFDSAADQILLTHAARTREGFASGALAAARWVRGRRGFYEFGEVIDEILRERT
ncbi:MAG TPA: dihydrodipicolinate reductase C-terminal domain-containing protein [Pyrinomonadaceae bacterium]|nr:dihydrodipicolinate reductase C-terminal domain-containing protein [Pyrinomonadaceae bacterium]